MIGKLCKTVVVSATVFVSPHLHAGICRLSVAGLNRERVVAAWADLNQECGGIQDCWHSPPYGNWGVDSNYGRRVDGDQFQGWYPEYPHLMWNCCTRDYPPGGEQRSFAGENVHGSKTVDVWVNCPEDIDSDGECDVGGCKDVWGYGESNNWATLFELDPGPWPCGIDDYVDTLDFPPTEVNLICEPGYCYAAGTGWAARTFSSFTYAEMAMVVNTGWYVDDMNCEYLRFGNPRYNCVW